MYYPENQSKQSRSPATLATTAIVALLFSGAFAANASAEVLNFSTNTTARVFAAPGVVDLNGTAGGVQNLNFFTNTPSIVEITFSAECAVNGNPNQWGSIEIQLNPAGAGGFAPISPTAGTDDAFCSGDLTGGLNSWVTASMTVAARVPQGLHTVRVLAGPVGGASQMRLDDLSITVDR